MSDQVVTIEAIREILNPKSVKRPVIILPKSDYDQLFKEYGQEFIEKQNIFCAERAKEV